MTTISPVDLELGRLTIVKSPPWSHAALTVKKRSFEKGKIPKHLEKHLFTKNGIPKMCSELTQNFQGKNRIMKMNDCIAEKSKK